MKSPYIPLIIATAAFTLVTSCKPKPATTAQTSSPEAAAPAPNAAPPDAPAPPVADNQPAPAAQNAPGARVRGGGGGAPRADFQQRAQQRMDQMKTALSLTDDQSAKVKAIMQDQFGAMRGQMQNMSREDRRAAFQKAREAVNAKIEEILTPDQKPKWDEYQKQMEALRAQRAAQGGGPGGGGRQ